MPPQPKKSHGKFSRIISGIIPSWRPKRSSQQRKDGFEGVAVVAVAASAAQF